eukprot:3118763-Pyramimonas_sp.AAC.2
MALRVATFNAHRAPLGDHPEDASLAQPHRPQLIRAQLQETQVIAAGSQTTPASAAPAALGGSLVTGTGAKKKWG